MADGLWPVLLVFYFWGWVGAVMLFIFSSFPGSGNVRSGPAVRWGGVWLLLFALWIVSMARC